MRWINAIFSDLFSCRRTRRRTRANVMKDVISLGESPCDGKGGEGHHHHITKVVPTVTCYQFKDNLSVMEFMLLQLSSLSGSVYPKPQTTSIHCIEAA